jgi:hypothetical protein
VNLDDLRAAERGALPEVLTVRCGRPGCGRRLGVVLSGRAGLLWISKARTVPVIDEPDEEPFWRIHPGAIAGTVRAGEEPLIVVCRNHGRQSIDHDVMLTAVANGRSSVSAVEHA